MGYVIAMAGKGGTGKTTLAALIVRVIKEKKLGSILAIDADPNSNLADCLGLQVRETVGGILDGIAADPDKVPVGMTKDRFIEYQVQSIISESVGFDLLTMGRPEGPGCYCYVNNVLRNIMAKLIKDYDYVIIDNEAGLEHLSRRTTRAADAMVIVSGPAAVGLKAARRISELSDELDIKIKNKFLIVNCYDKDLENDLIKSTGINYLGFIPEDKFVEKIALSGNSLMELENDAKSISALLRIGEKIWLRN
jgi:CO dehydrogenase maturation factor